QWVIKAVERKDRQRRYVRGWWIRVVPHRLQLLRRRYREHLIAQCWTVLITVLPLPRRRGIRYIVRKNPRHPIVILLNDVSSRFLKIGFRAFEFFHVVRLLPSVIKIPAAIFPQHSEKRRDEFTIHRHVTVVIRDHDVPLGGSYSRFQSCKDSAK